MSSLEERICACLDSSDFNNLPFEERKRIGKYLDRMQILTLWQVLQTSPDLTCTRWKREIRDWLKDCVESFEWEYLR